MKLPAAQTRLLDQLSQGAAYQRPSYLLHLCDWDVLQIVWDRGRALFHGYDAHTTEIFVEGSTDGLSIYQEIRSMWSWERDCGSYEGFCSYAGCDYGVCPRLGFFHCRICYESAGHRDGCVRGYRQRMRETGTAVEDLLTCSPTPLSHTHPVY